jgi:hypothetical protein
MRSYLFICQERNTQELESLLTESSNVLAIKGFSNRLNKNWTLHENFIELCRSHSVFVFDGDHFGDTSFTKAITCVPDIRKTLCGDKAEVLLLALVFKSAANMFIESWHGRLVLISNEGEFVSSSTSADCNKEELDKGDAYRITLNYILIDDCDYEIDLDRYCYLGVKGMEIFQPSAVASFGGGTCILAEFEAYVARLGDVHGVTSQKPLIWHCFPPNTRPNAPGDGQEMCILLSIEHEHIVKHF